MSKRQNITLKMDATCNKKNTLSYKTLFEVFPKPTSENDSTMFFMKVFAAAVSHITYLRGIFPEYLYKSRYVEDITLKILSGTDVYPAAHDLIHQMEGIFDAFQRKYLEQAILGFHTVNDDTVPIEAYIFKFGYFDTENESERISCTLQQKSVGSQGVDDSYTPLPGRPTHNVEENTMRLLNQIIQITNAMVPLPKQVVIRWKLLYFDNVTPKDYEPSGFMSTALNVPVIQGNNLGNIVSPFHQIGCDFTVNRNEQTSMDTNISESVVTDDSWPIPF